jgi:hypothetical protein
MKSIHDHRGLSKPILHGAISNDMHVSRSASARFGFRDLDPIAPIRSWVRGNADERDLLCGNERSVVR